MGYVLTTAFTVPATEHYTLHSDFTAIYIVLTIKINYITLQLYILIITGNILT